MLRWTFPYLLFVSLTALAGGVLNSYQKFALPAFTSVVLNVVMIVFAAWISPYFEQPVLALARRRVRRRHPAGRDAGAGACCALRPAALAALESAARGRAAHRAADGAGDHRLVDGTAERDDEHGIASLLADGSMTWLYFADRLVEFPLGVFSIALATVILPSLSAHHAQRDARGVLDDARLGAAARVPDRDSRVGRAVRARRAADGGDLSPRQVQRDSTST